MRGLAEVGRLDKEDDAGAPASGGIDSLFEVGGTDLELL